MENITAIITRPGREAGRNYGGDKEMTAAYSLVVLNGGGLREVLVFRAYMGRSKSASTVYGTIWAFPNAATGADCVSGSGKAGGGGYHKESGALAAALHHAGIQILDTTGNPVPIGGRGTSQYKDVFCAIARAQGWNTSTSLLIRH